jgi:DNA-binding response OmpR family regulator
VKKVLIIDSNPKVFENQLKTAEVTVLEITNTELTLNSVLEKKPDLIIVNQSFSNNLVKETLQSIFEAPKPLPVILITKNGPEKQSFDAWVSPSHVVKEGDWDQFKLTVKEIFSFFS